MDDKRTAIAMLLCFMVVMFYMELVISPQTRRAAKQVVTATPSATSSQPGAIEPPASGSQSAATSPAALPAASSQTVKSSGPQAFPSLEELNNAPTVRLETPLYNAEVTQLGARLMRWSLNRYRKTLKGEIYEMVRLQEGAPAPLGVYFSNEFNDALLKYELIEVAPPLPALQGNYLLADGQEISFKFEATLSNGSKLRKNFKFRGGSYLIDVEVALEPALSATEQIWLEWSEAIDAEVFHRRLNPEMYFALNSENKLARISLQEMHDGPINELGATQWISYGDNYFMTALVPRTPSASAKVGALGVSTDTEAFSAIGRLSTASAAAQYSVYLGPKDYRILGELGYQLERNVDLGFFSFLAYPLLQLLRAFYSFIGNYGLAIILLTLFIKLLFLPLTQASFKSMRAMQELQPEIKALRERVKDSTQLNQEMAALFKRRGVNPMGGCLPVLIQIPVFFGLFSALMHSIELRHSAFALWVTDLSSPEYLNIFGLPVPVLVLLWGAFMVIQQRTTPQSASIDPMQQKIFNFMPIMFTIMCIVFPMPSGLVLYWLVNIVISIIQQAAIRSDKNASPLTSTLLASAAIFALGYILTLV